MTEYQVIGKKLKELREMKELSQEDLAIILGIKQPYYSQLENGKKKITIEQITKIANEFDLPLDWFLGRDVRENIKLKEKHYEIKTQFNGPTGPAK